MSALPPGSTVGILGAGQLGRMLAAAAAQLGYQVRVYAPDTNPPAAQLANGHVVGGYTEEATLKAFAPLCDVITFEFENIDVSALELLQSVKPVRPGPNCLAIAQDRLLEKDYLSSIGIECAPYKAVDSKAALQAAISELGLPAVLKTRRFGYDGKGQTFIRSEADIEEAWDALGNAPGGLILEGFVNFEREVSAIVVRGIEGDTKAYPPVWNVHANHILQSSTVPAGIPAEVGDVAISQALDLAEALDYVGTLTVEYFVDADGGLRANEIAPRVHNSGHWTIEGAQTSQFENHIRAICGLPLGETQARGTIHMENLIGNQISGMMELLSKPGAHVHHYGKPSIRVGRKMGHVTFVDKD